MEWIAEGITLCFNMKTIAQFFNPFGGYFACITDRLAKYFKVEKIPRSPEEMYDWMIGTGDIAGAMQMFTDAEFFREKVIEKIRLKLQKDGKYTTYQTYVYGIFAKE